MNISNHIEHKTSLGSLKKKNPTCLRWFGRELRLEF